MLFSMAGVNAAEDDSSDGIIINDTNVTQEDNPLQSDDNDSTDNGTEDTGDQTDTITYQTSAEGSSGSVTVEEVETAASELKNYVEIHNSLPDTIQVGSYTLTMAQFLNVLLNTTLQLDQEIYDRITINTVDDAPNPSGNVNSGNILKSEYLENAVSILNFMDTYGRAPNYGSTSLGNLRFEGLVFSFAKIIDFYKDFDRLPNYAVIIQSDFMGSVTVEEVEAAASELKNYVEIHNSLPDTIQVGSKYLTMAQFLSVLLNTTLQLDQGNYSPIKIIAMGDAPNPTGEIVSGNILKSEYLLNATNILNFMDSYGRAPNYCNITLGNSRFEYMVLSFAKIIDFYKENDRLPNYTKILPTDSIGSVTFEEIEEAAVYLKEYITALKFLPKTIQVGSYTLTMSEFLKILLTTVINSDQNIFTPVNVTDVNNSPNPAGQKISANILKSEYMQNAIDILNFMDTYGRAPNYWKTSLGNLRFEYVVFSFAKIMDFQKEYNRLPNYALIHTSDILFNVIDAPGNLLQYLMPTDNCQSLSSTIINFAKNLTKNCYTDYDKAKVIFEWVRDYCSYTFYYNTKYGAVEMLNRKDGNCIDHSHLINALARSVGIPARYAHAQCKFTSMTVGHIWSELYVNGRWVTADATSTRNNLGTQVNCSILYWKGRYAELPF
jgi:flagellar motor switch/type III secretory pathway protein FliN